MTLAYPDAQTPPSHACQEAARGRPISRLATIVAIHERHYSTQKRPNYRKEMIMAIVPALVGEIVNQYVPFAGVAIGTALDRCIARRKKDAADRLLDEFRNGRIDQISWASEDEFAGMLLRYLNAVRDSAGLVSLRLMAKVMVGQIQCDRIYADEFTRYANMLASLSRDEILAITCLHKARLASKTPENVEGVWKEMVKAVIPAHFPSEQYVHAVLTAASRSGLVITPHDLFAVGVYMTSPLMDEISQLADFQDALHREKVAE